MATSNAGTIYASLKNGGLGNAQIAGVMANALNESGYSPTASGDGGAAIGIFQWEGGRRNNLRAMGDETDINVQLAYMWKELHGRYLHVLTEINTTNDPATVAKYWDVGPGGVNSGTGYENSAGLTTTKREQDAVAIHTQLEAGQVPTGGGSVQGKTPVTWAQPGKWTSFNGKPIPDPPAGTIQYSGTKTGVVGSLSGDRLTAYGPERDKEVWAWMLKYFDDGSLAKRWGNQVQDHPSMRNTYLALIQDQPKASQNENSLPDPGPAQAGIGPVDWGGIMAQLGKILSWLTTLKNWERIGLMVLGAVILLFAIDFMFGKNLPIPGV